MAKKPDAPLERQPVFLSMLILKEMGIDTEDPRIAPFWQELWLALAAYRDARKTWTTKVLQGILSGQATFDSGSEWHRLNVVLNQIWEACNAEAA